jgi:branched-chain amino acid transport system permease protein
MRTPLFIVLGAVVAALVFAGARLVGNDYVFFAGYTVLQFVVLATAWNILGGYTGYVNFGTAAFFALGAYSTVFFHKFYPLPIPVLVVLGAAVSGLVGLGMGYLTLRLRGAFFAIATLALAVVLQTQHDDFGLAVAVQISDNRLAKSAEVQAGRRVGRHR